jgi:hypothetical protein
MQLALASFVQGLTDGLGGYAGMRGGKVGLLKGLSGPVMGWKELIEARFSGEIGLKEAQIREMEVWVKVLERAWEDFFKNASESADGARQAYEMGVRISQTAREAQKIGRG